MSRVSRTLWAVSAAAALLAPAPSAAQQTSAFAGTAEVAEQVRHDLQLASLGLRADGAEGGSGFAQQAMSRPEWWLLGVAALGMGGELLSDSMTESARKAYSANPSEGKFQKALFWEGTRNTMALVWIPAATVGVSWWGWKRFGHGGGPVSPVENAPVARTPEKAAPAERPIEKPVEKQIEKPAPVVKAAEKSGAKVVPATPVPTATFSSTPVPPAATPTTAVAAAPNPKTAARDEAKRHFDKGMKHYQSGNKLGANFEFTQAGDVDPTYPDVQKWIERINQELSSPRSAAPPSGEDQMGAKQQKVVDSHLRQASDFYSHGEYKKAIAEYHLVLELVNQNVEAAKRLQEAESKMKEALEQNMNAARQAREKGQLAAEIRAWQKALRVDDENAEAKRSLSDAQGRIPEEVNRLYRLGLDKYSEDKVQEAVDLWKKVLDLDANHERTKVVLDKAQRKLEEIKASKVGQ